MAVKSEATVATMRPVTAGTSVAARFRDVAASMPGEVALVGARARFSYREIDQWSDAIAAEIVATDPSRESPVAIVLRNQVSVVPAMLAVVKAGRCFVMLDAAEPGERIATLLNAAGAGLCLIEDDAPQALRGRNALRVGAPRSASSVPRDVPPHELIQIAFTSGTTGTPKGVASRQHGFVERLVGGAIRTGRALGERVSYTAVPGAARARGEILGSLLGGATLCAFDARTERLDTLGELIEREHVSILTLAPALFRRFMRALPADTDLSSVRKLRISADVVSMADVDAWRSRFPASSTLEFGYSSTEAGNVMHVTISRDTPLAGPLVPMGRPIAGVDVWVIDEEGNEVAGGETGELVVRSEHVARGYWNAPELTAERFSFDASRPDAPTVRTGDLVRREADGLYYFVGRRDARMKIHGRRIDPLEVESALILHAGAREAVVLAEPGEDGEAQLAAWVVAGGAPAEPRAIRAAMRGKVPAWMVPSRVHFIDELPLTAAGKVDRDALSQRAVTSPGEGTADIVELEGMERTILETWMRVLRTRVELDDDYFEDLGGTSLDALEIVAEISRITGRSLPLSILLELNTARKLAGYLVVQPDTERTVIALQRNGSFPPLFCVSGKGGGVIVFRELAAALGSEQPFYGLTYHGIDPQSLPTTLAAFAACYVDAIREKQPEGPYFLAGYSGGGFVAYEMARQLARAGHVVAFLGLFDTGASRERAPLARRYGKYWSIFRRDPAAFVARGGRAVRLLVRLTIGWVRAGGKAPFVPEVAANRFYDSLNLRESLQPFSGPVTLFLAREGLGAEVAPHDAGWSALCGDGVEIVDIDGEHDSILTTEVEGFARELSRAIATARDRVLGSGVAVG